LLADYADQPGLKKPTKCAWSTSGYRGDSSVQISPHKDSTRWAHSKMQLYMHPFPGCTFGKAQAKFQADYQGKRQQKGP